MTFETFKQSLQDGELPPGLSPELTALWHEGRGDWDTAHQMVQYEAGSDPAHIHAYLHRKEGDLANADYWYREAGIQRPAVPLEQEYDEILQYFLNKISHCKLDF